jgi:hypothetical protein
VPPDAPNAWRMSGLSLLLRKSITVISLAAVGERLLMKKLKKEQNNPTTLRFVDLDQAKTAVTASVLKSFEAQCAAAGPADLIFLVKMTNGAPMRQAQPRIQKQSREPNNPACC